MYHDTNLPVGNPSYFSNGDTVWIQFVEEIICKHQIHERFHIYVKPKVFVITS